VKALNEAGAKLEHAEVGFDTDRQKGALRETMDQLDRNMAAIPAAS
jgi:hypothetical protein